MLKQWQQNWNLEAQEQVAYDSANVQCNNVVLLAALSEILIHRLRIWPA